MKNKLIYAAVTVVAALAWYALPNTPQREGVRAAESVPVESGSILNLAPTAFVEAASAPILAAAPVANTPEQRNEMAHALLTTTNVRRFVEDALKHPEQGGGYYAALALSQCDGMSPKESVVQEVIEQDGKITPDQLAKITLMHDRCAGLTEQQIGSLYLEIDQLAAKDQRLAMLKKGEITPGTDGQVVNLMMANKSTFGRDGTQTLIFNGHIYIDPKEIAALNLAARFSQCVEGDYCDIDRMMINSCRNAGRCYASRDDYVQAKYFKDDKQLREKAQHFTDEIRAAIARGDLSIFR